MPNKIHNNQTNMYIISNSQTIHMHISQNAHSKVTDDVMDHYKLYTG